MLHIKDKEPIKTMPADFFLCELAKNDLLNIAQRLELGYSHKLSKQALLSKLTVIYSSLPAIVGGHISAQAASALESMAYNDYETVDADLPGLDELVKMALALPLDDDERQRVLFVAPRAIAGAILKTLHTK